jgi:hypothetical protein
MDDENKFFDGGCGVLIFLFIVAATVMYGLFWLFWHARF